MNLIWATSLRVFPQHCNHHNGMIFGGEMLAQMDLVAAAAVSRFLYDSPKGVSEALTVGVDKVIFHKGAKVGDLIIFTATITDVGQKRISVNVSAEKESLEEENKSKRDIKYSHNLETGVLHKQVNYEYAKVKKPVRSKMAEGLFHFCAYDMEKGKGTEHGMILPVCTLWCHQSNGENEIDNQIAVYSNKQVAERLVELFNLDNHDFSEHWHIEDYDKNYDKGLKSNLSVEEICANFHPPKRVPESKMALSLRKNLCGLMEPVVQNPD